MVTQKFVPESKRNILKKQKQLELKQNMRSSLPVLDRHAVIKFRLPYHEGVLYELHVLGYTSSEQFLRQLIEYQEDFRKNYSPESAVYNRPRLLQSHKDIQILSNGLKVAEISHFQDNIGQEIDEFIKLGIFYGFGPIDWWWLGQQILMQTIKLSDDYTKDDNKRKTVTKYLYGKFLLENMNNESEAHDYLHEARHLATGKLWRVRELDIGQESVFKECCKLLYKILMAMGKKIAKSDPMQAIRLYAVAEKHAADACIIPEQVDAILLQGLCTMDTGNANSALLMFSKAIFFCNNLKLTEKLCETNIYFALAYVKVGKSDEAVKVLKKLLLEAEQNNLPFYVAQANKFIGEYYLNEGKPHMATPFLMKALEKFHELEDISNREQTKNLAAISAGQELLPKYVAVILKCNYGSGFENVFKINKWKDCREMFWDDGNLSSNDSGQSLIDFLGNRTKKS